MRRPMATPLHSRRRVDAHQPAHLQEHEPRSEDGPGPYHPAVLSAAVFAVNASLNVKTFDELAALAKAKPKTMNYLTPSLSKVAFMEAYNKNMGSTSSGFRSRVAATPSTA